MAAAWPPLTIGLPVYNGERYLAEAIDSVLAQTFTDLRLVIGDNASDDATADIVADAASRDERIEVRRADRNRGAAWNFNRVLADSGSAYVKWLAADDALAPTNAEATIAALAEHGPSVVLAHPRTVIIDADSVEVEIYDLDVALPHDRPSDRYGALVRQLMRANPLFGTIRAEALARTRMLGGYFRADTVLLSELALVGKWLLLDEALFLRRLHEANSLEANTTARERRRFYDTGGRDRTVELAHLRVLSGELSAYRHLGLPAAEIARCVRHLRHWQFKWMMARELTQAPLALVGR